MHDAQNPPRRSPHVSGDLDGSGARASFAFGGRGVGPPWETSSSSESPARRQGAPNLISRSLAAGNLRRPYLLRVHRPLTDRSILVCNCCRPRPVQNVPFPKCEFALFSAASCRGRTCSRATESDHHLVRYERDRCDGQEFRHRIQELRHRIRLDLPLDLLCQAECRSLLDEGVVAAWKYGTYQISLAEAHAAMRRRRGWRRPVFASFLTRRMRHA
eukprot:4478898-Prymnesium_polylepis.1